MDDVCFMPSHGLVQILPLSGLGKSDNLLRLQRLPEVIRMPTEMELEEQITEEIDRERVKEAILSLEISQLRETLDKLERV